MDKLYRELVKLNDSVFENIGMYLAGETAKGYLVLIKRDDENGIIEFKIGQFRFLFQSEIRPYKRQILHKSFYRTLDMEHYPSLRYNSQYIQEMDIFTHYSSAHEFRTPKVSEATFKRAGVSIPIRHLESHEFGKTLIEQLERWLLEQSEKSV